MLTSNDSDRNLEDLTDAEIYSAIRYLEPYPRNADEQVRAATLKIVFIIKRT